MPLHIASREAPCGRRDADEQAQMGARPLGEKDMVRPFQARWFAQARIVITAWPRLFLAVGAPT
jgi:hypothetical protein